MSRSRLNVLRRKEPLRVGFLPVNDAAPLIYASEGGVFVKYDLDVELQRESSWANIRDKVIYGSLDAAQAPATLPFLANFGLESDPCACVSGLVLSLEGNALTISRKLWDQGVRSPATLRERIFEQWSKRTFTFGVMFSCSVHEILLRRWLKSAGIIPEEHVRIVSIPPTQMYPTLKLGYIDGFCAGEPWASIAVEAGVGVCLATSAQLAPLHPEKVLMVRQSFAAGRSEEHERLLAALLESCAFCEDPDNHVWLGEMLAHTQYLNAPAEAISRTLGPAPGSSIRALSGASIFRRFDANDPTDAKARWIMDCLYELMAHHVFWNEDTLRELNRTPVLKNIFRRDLYERAKAVMESSRRAKAPATAARQS